jgi:hypothetical protein
VIRRGRRRRSAACGREAWPLDLLGWPLDVGRRREIAFLGVHPGGIRPFDEPQGLDEGTSDPRKVTRF